MLLSVFLLAGETVARGVVASLGEPRVGRRLRLSGQRTRQHFHGFGAGADWAHHIDQGAADALGLGRLAPCPCGGGGLVPGACARACSSKASQR